MRVNKIFLLVILMVTLMLTITSCKPAEIIATPEISSLPQAPLATTLNPPQSENEQANNETVATATPIAEILKANEYVVNMEIDPITRKIVGVEKVDFQNHTDIEMNKVNFNVYLNAFSADATSKPYFDGFNDKIFRNGKDYGYMDFIGISIDKEDIDYEINETAMTVTLPEPLAPGDSTQITIQFEAYVPKINHRTGANNQAMWCGNFLPTLAVNDKFGWHKASYYPAGDPFYSEIANYLVTIKTPKDYIVAATGNKSEVATENGITTTFDAKMVRDFAFALSKEYQIDTITTKQGIDISMYHYSTLNTKEFLTIAERSLDYYSETIGSYPYDQLSIVETEFFLSGGMEYPQLIFMDSAYLKKKESVRSLAHEIGHQWFYNIIGNNQVKEAWLDEGLTMCVQEGIFYDKEGLATKMQADYNYLKEILEDIAPKSLSQDLSVYKSWSDYYNIQYTKGKLMIYSLNQKMGDQLFGQFLKDYYTKFSFGIANTDDFIQTAEAVYGQSLEDFFDRWLLDYDLPPLG